MLKLEWLTKAIGICQLLSINMYSGNRIWPLERVKQVLAYGNCCGQDRESKPSTQGGLIKQSTLETKHDTHSPQHACKPKPNKEYLSSHCHCLVEALQIITQKMKHNLLTLITVQSTNSLSEEQPKFYSLLTKIILVLRLNIKARLFNPIQIFYSCTL